MEGVLGWYAFGFPFDIVDIVEMVEMVDPIDSLEIFRLTWSDGLRGGKAGESCVDSFL